MPRSGNQEAKKAVKPNWLSIKRFGLINSLGISCARRYSLAYSLASIAIIIILLIKLCRWILASEISSVAIKLDQLHKFDTMNTTSPPSEIFEKEHIDKKEYLKNELKSLGIETKRKNHLNDNEELQNLSDNIKQAMFQDYKIAYSEKGDMHKEEAESTVTVG